MDVLMPMVNKEVVLPFDQEDAAVLQDVGIDGGDISDAVIADDNAAAGDDDLCALYHCNSGTSNSRNSKVFLSETWRKVGLELVVVTSKSTSDNFKPRNSRNSCSASSAPPARRM
jgi:hypothetical protein